MEMPNPTLGTRLIVTGLTGPHILDGLLLKLQEFEFFINDDGFPGCK